MKQLTLKKAREITGGLSKPSKMPGYGYGLPAVHSCPGSMKFIHDSDSICGFCYARKGRYGFRNVFEAQMKRLRSITHPQWVEAMVTLISKESDNKDTRYFRWHDSGDIVNAYHLQRIFKICRLTPDILHWLPTKNIQVIRKVIRETCIPNNLVIRVSNMYPDKLPPVILDPGVKGCAVNTSKQLSKQFRDAGVFLCPAYKQGGHCLECRRCWSRKTEVVSYPKH